MKKHAAKTAQTVHATGHLLCHVAATVLQVHLWGKLLTGEAEGFHLFLITGILLLLSFSYLCLGLILHEGAHRNLSPNRRVNDALFYVAAAIIQTVPSLYKAVHWSHHKNLNEKEDWELNPETNAVLIGVKRRRALLRLMLLGGLERNRLQERLLWNPRAPLTDALRRRAKLELLGLKLLLVFGSGLWIYGLGFTSWLVGYAVPAIAGGWLLVWVQLIEHFGMSHGRVPEATRDVEPRNRFHRLVYWALFNINYHGVHHDNASIPGCMLSDAHATWKKQLALAETPASDPFPSYFAALKNTLPALWAELRPKIPRGAGC